MKRNDTYWTSLQACDHHFKETGAIPTIVVIRDRIGVNSPNIISQAIKDFKGSLADQVVKARKDLSGIPTPVVNLAIDLWEAAKAEALAASGRRQDGDAKREQALAEENRQLALDLAASRQVTVQLGEELDRAHASRQDAERRLSQTEAQAQAQLDKLFDQNAQLEARLSGLSEELTQEKQRRINAEVAYERQNDWAMQRIAEEKDIMKRHYALELSQLKAAINKLKHDNQLLQAKLNTALRPDDPAPAAPANGGAE